MGYGINGFGRSIRRARWLSLARPTKSAARSKTAYNQLRFNEVHLQVGQGYLEKGEVIDELDLFANKVMPHFT